jgi:hypothetical protein
MSSMPEDPERDPVAADERRIGELLHAAQVPAPAPLHRRIGELAGARAPRARRTRRPLVGLAGGFAAGIVLAIVLGSAASSKPPTLLRVSQVALDRASGPAPRSLHAAGTAIAFPQWSSRGWPSAGTRSDRVGGRTVTTEFYSSNATGRLGYSIVSGAPLRWGAGERVVAREGYSYRLVSHAGATIVAWVQSGHTCVLVSRTAPAAALLALAVAEDRAAAL